MRSAYPKVSMLMFAIVQRQGLSEEWLVCRSRWLIVLSGSYCACQTGSKSRGICALGRCLHVTRSSEAGN
jgi:hypothetical protein